MANGKNIELKNEIENNQYTKDLLRAIFIGHDDDIDKMIMRFMSHGYNQGCVTNDKLILYFVYKELVCSERRLFKRLEVLEKHKYIEKKKHKNIIYYEIDNNEY